MDKCFSFKKSIQYIEDNLNGDIGLEAVAHAGFTSVMQLYRDYYAFTGHSVKEYIRKRRLSNALNMIKFSDMPLVDIAYVNGYSSQQALCKYVKAATNMTPITYKKSETYYYFPMFTGEIIRQVTVETQTIPQSIVMKYYNTQLRGIENRAINSFLSIIPDFKGRIFGRNGKQLDSRFCYELSIEYDSISFAKLKQVTNVFAEMKVLPSKTQTFAKTTVKNIEEEICFAWDYLYVNWLKTSMFIQDDDNYFEEYLHKDGHIKKLVLFLPVKKRNDYNKITINNCESKMFLVATRKGYNAEEKASKAVVDFLFKNYPDILKNVRRFYMERNALNCICGVSLEEVLDLAEGSNLEIIQLTKGDYAIVEGDCCYDSSVYASLLLSWINDNNLLKDNTLPFTIYEIDKGYDSKSIKTKTYIKLKYVKNQ